MRTRQRSCSSRRVYGGKRIAEGDAVFVFRTSAVRPDRPRGRHSAQSRRSPARPADAAREHQGPAHGAREARLGRASQPLHQVARRRPETELNFKFYRRDQQDRGHLGQDGEILDGFF